jgi:hypothetical protein
MTITSGDIKLLRSEVLLDTVDGGGAITAVEVVDGVSNNLFPDISELDRAYGRISLRKFFPAIQTTTVDSYYGSHVILTKLPSDPKVNISLFTTNNWTDRRANAQNNIESYLARGPKWAGHLLETQLVGQRAIQLALQESDPTPVIGQGLALVQFEGLPNEYSQFVRISKITETSQTFPAPSGTVTRRIVTLEITDPLRYQFDGISVFQAVQGTASVGICRDTRVADAATYYSANRLSVATSIGAAQIQADSIFTALVPSAQSETPMVDLAPSGQSALYVPGNTTPITIAVQTSTATNSNVYLGSPILPNTLSFTLFGQAVVDAGGILKAGSTQIGTIEYDKGLLRFNSSAPSGTGVVTYVFTPAATPSRVAQTAFFSVTQSNRSYNYVTTLVPTPTPASLVVSYMTQGKVYYLYDNGVGQIKGADASFGSGTINYVTGTVLLTVGALPDVGTDILYSWGANTSTFSRANLPVKPLQFLMQSATSQIAPSTLAITWTLNAVTKVASDDGAGNLIGDATGSINYATGKITLIPTLLPMIGTVFGVTASHGDPLTFTETVSAGSPSYTYTLSGSAPIIPGTVSIDLQLKTIDGYFRNVTLVDKFVSAGSGNLVLNGTTTLAGTINYTARQVTVNPSLTASVVVGVPDFNTFYLGG